MKKYGVLGCGWLGLPVAKSFVEKGITVNGSTTTENKLDSLREENITPFLIKLPEVNQTELASFFSQLDFLLINFPPKRIEGIEQIYLEQLNTVIPFIETQTKIIFISSTSVYPNTNDVVKEDMVLKPEKASGNTLVLSEELLKKTFGNRLTILRLAGLFNEERHPGRFLRRKKVWNNGEGAVNLIHQKDCVRLINLIIEQERWGEVFNGCSDNHPTRKEFYTKSAQYGGFEIPVFEDSKPSFKIVSNDKTKRVLGFDYEVNDVMVWLSI